jgi:hypothetical protein
MDINENIIVYLNMCHVYRYIKIFIYLAGPGLGGNGTGI